MGMMMVIGAGVGGVGARGAETGVASWIFLSFAPHLSLSLFGFCHSCAFGRRELSRPGWQLRERHPRNRAALAAHMLAAVWLLEARIWFHKCIKRIRSIRPSQWCTTRAPSSPSSSRKVGAPVRHAHRHTFSFLLFLLFLLLAL